MRPRQRTLALRDANARRLIVGFSVSQLADGMFLVSIPLAAVSLGGSPLLVGVASAAVTAWWILAIPLSTIVDRVGPGPLLKLVRPGRVLAAFVIAGHAAIPSGFGAVVLVSGAALWGALEVLSDTASHALPPLVLHAELLDDVYSLQSLSTRIFQLVIGAATGATLLQMATWLPFIAVAALLVVAYAVLFPLFNDSRARTVRARTPERWWREVTMGVAHIRRTPLMRAALVTMVGVVVASETIAVTLPSLFEAASNRETWARELGMARSASGIAAIAATLAAAGLARRFGRIPVMCFAVVLMVIAPLLLVNAPLLLVVVAAALALEAIGEALWVPLMQSEMVRSSPHDLLARTRGAVLFVTWGLIPLTALGVGLLASTVGSVVVLVAASFAVLTSAAAGIWRFGWHSDASNSGGGPPRT